MAYSQAGLHPSGTTAYFNVFYHTDLSPARGRDVAAGFIATCDDDHRWLQDHFRPTALNPLGMPITLQIDPADDDNLLRTSWRGWGPVPYQITVQLGELPFNGMTPVQALRWVVVHMVSQLFMRSRQDLHPWIRWYDIDAGLNGSALALAMSVAFVRERMPTARSLPGATATTDWLSAASRDDFISGDPPTPASSVQAGCAAAYLMYVHEELGHPLPQIIDAAADNLAGVFNNLTRQPASQAFAPFADLVNLHYPVEDGPYDPPLASVFPVAHLTHLFASAKISWVGDGRAPRLRLSFDKQLTVPVKVRLDSSDPHLVGVQSVFVASPSQSELSVPLLVNPQDDNFAARRVVLRATYAGRTVSFTVEVVTPDELLPVLGIDVDRSSDPCMRPFEAGSPLTLRATLPDLFAGRGGLSFDWTVKGSTAPATHGPTIRIAALPAAGVSVVVDVKARSASGIVGRGKLQFTVLQAMDPLHELDRRVRCKVQSMRLMHVHVPPWIAQSGAPLDLVQINQLRGQLQALAAPIAEAQELLARLEHTHKAGKA